MNNAGKLAGCVAVLAALGAQAYAASQIDLNSFDDRYQKIVMRNIFDQRTEPVVGPAPETKKVPPNVKLVGVLKLSGKPEAVIWMQEAGAPQKPPTTTRMTVGQRVGSVEVLEIDAAERTARVQIDEDISLLKLEDKPMPGAGGPAVAVGGRGGGLITSPLSPSINRSGGSPLVRPGAPNLPAIPAIPNAAASPSAFQGNSSLSPSINPGGIPNRQVRTGDDSAQPQLTAEQQMILMEAQRNAAKQSGSPIANIIPPTQLGDMLNQADAQAAAAAAAAAAKSGKSSGPPGLPGR